MTAAQTARRPRLRSGFTLLELLVVLAILGLIIGLVTPRLVGYLGSAKQDVARVQLENLAAALDLYRIDAGRYPDSERGLGALVQRPPEAQRWNGPYLKGSKVPTDPWGRPFAYRNPSQHGQAYDLYSLGADGAEGGDGEDADVTNW